MSEIWKKFEETKLSHSNVHHLLAVYRLLKEKGYARAADVSRHLKISRSSAFLTLKKLKEKGYLTEDENKFLKLTSSSLRLISNTLNSKQIVERFFKEVLFLSSKKAEEEACKIEHLISSETADAIDRFMMFLKSDKTKKSVKSKK
ncbi:MAG: metal-dependent transcriptional regulator [Ignavibacteria bacterium]|nr:metal-dependent transcriptional regulator [Ignavibacteria bacterium]